jgi:hypothetical protein
MKLEDDELDKFLMRGGNPEDFADGFVKIYNEKFSMLDKKVNELSEKYDKKVEETVDKILGNIGNEETNWLFNITKPKRDVAIGYVKGRARSKASEAYISQLGIKSTTYPEHAKENAPKGYHWEYSGGFDGNKIWDSKKLVKDK